MVVPCFNEEEVLSELHRRVSEVCQEEAGDDYELILVNDGSRDRTWPTMTDLTRRDPHVVAVALSRNHGHQLALSAGLSVSVGDRILVLDADLQDPPELLPEMMRLMDAGADVVYGKRVNRRGESWFKKGTAAIFYRLLVRLTEVNIPVDTGDFRLMSRRVLTILNSMPEQYRFVRGMVSWIGFTQVPLPYERRERLAGKTKYPLRKMIPYSVDAITGFSIRPLRLAVALGLLFAMLGALGLVYAFASWLSGETVPGWTSVILTVMILSSAQLFTLGIMGEYLGRIYMENKHRPMFIIDRIARQGYVDPDVVLPRRDGIE